MSAPVGDAAPVRSEEWLCLALYTASRAMTARYRPALAQLGLTYPQYLVMTALWEDGPCTVGQLGARLHLDSSTLSPLLKRLDGMGLITRSRDTRDERTVNVSPTPRGQALRSDATGIPAEICAATALPPAELGELVAQLQQLSTDLERSTHSAVHD
ncbi:MAG: MarR family transcriptional regulator [Mycobacteriaceae bacterium]